jgi:hypothetical protein
MHSSDQYTRFLHRIIILRTTLVRFSEDYKKSVAINFLDKDF